MSEADRTSAGFAVHVLVRRPPRGADEVILVTADRIHAHQQFARGDVGPGSRLETYQADGLEWTRTRVLVVDVDFLVCEETITPSGTRIRREVELDTHRHHLAAVPGSPVHECACGFSVIGLDLGLQGPLDGIRGPVGIRGPEGVRLPGWEAHQQRVLDVLSPRADPDQ